MKEVLYYCEKCGKPVYDKFGSGRFCSRSCANSRNMTDEIRLNISLGMSKENICKCRYCNKEFANKNSRASHERLCSLNPYKQINYGGVKNHELKLQRNVRIIDTSTNMPVDLDITYYDLENYRSLHPVCEICGKPIEKINKPDSKVKYKGLCIDHDHATNKFRGLLCITCNRNLGWYENNSDSIKLYLSKNK